MTIKIDTRVIVAFAAGVIFSKKVKKLVKNLTESSATRLKSYATDKAVNAKNDILKKMHRAVDVAFYEDTIDIPVR